MLSERLIASQSQDFVHHLAAQIFQNLWVSLTKLHVTIKKL